MIKFKLKEFWVGTALTAAGAIGSAIGIKQSSDLMKLSLELADAAQELNERIARLLNKIQKTAAQNPQAVLLAAQVIGQKLFGVFDMTGMAATLIQGHKQLKLAERIGALTEASNARLQLAIENLLASQNVAPVPMPNSLQLKLFALLGTVRTVGRELGGFGANVARVANNNRGMLIGTAVTGAIGAGVGYGVNKAIQLDKMRRGEGNEIALNSKETRKDARKWIGKTALKAGLVAGGLYAGKKGAFNFIDKNHRIQNNLLWVNKANVKRLGSEVGQTFKEHGKSMLGLGGVLAVLPVAGTVTNYVNERIDKHQLQNAPLPKYVPALRLYSILSPIINTIKNPKATVLAGIRSLNHGWNGFKRHPGQSMIGTISGSMGGLGRELTTKAGYYLLRLGKLNNNLMTLGLGKFLVKHPKTSMLGSMAVVGGAIGAAYQFGHNAIRNTANAVDKKAYGYENSLNQQ